MVKEEFKEIFNKIEIIGIDFFENSNLLEKTVKELVTDKLIENIHINKKQEEEFYSEFLKENGLDQKEKFRDFLIKNNFPKKIFLKRLIRSLKIQTYYIKEFKTKAKDYFSKNKNLFDKVTYSLIRTSDHQLAKELYLQIEGGEKNIYELSEKFSLGDEKFSKGIVGPIPLNQSHKLICQKLNSSKEGELLEPFKINDWWIILKIEKLLKIKFTPKLERSICNDLFEKRILKTSMIIIKELRSIPVCG